MISLVMPIYEYECRDCHNDFELLVHTGSSPVCPTCASDSLQKRISAFAVGALGTATAASVSQSCGTCGDPRGAGACSMN
jgi:putative FmdB family regulatory protein